MVISYTLPFLRQLRRLNYYTVLYNGNLLISGLILDYPLVLELLKRSHLTYIQLDTYLCEKRSSRELTSLQERVSLREGVRVSKGSYLRTFRQAQESLRRCIFTLVLMEYLELVPHGTLYGITRIGELVRVREDLEIEKIALVIDDVVSRLV